MALTTTQLDCTPVLNNTMPTLRARIGRVFLAVVPLFLTGLAWAQNAANTGTASVNPPPSSTDHLLQTTLGLLFVLGLLLLLAWALKRAGFAPKQKRGGFYRVLATSALGPREKIVLVEIGDTWLVLGMTSQSINTLHSMPAGSIAIEEMQNPAEAFAKLLDRVKSPKVKS